MEDVSENNLSPVLSHFKVYEQFCKAMLDAYAVVDAAGRVVKTNQLMTQLTGFKTKQILKANSFDDLIKLSIDGQTLTIADVLRNFSSPTRIDEVSGESQANSELNLILGVFPFVDGGKLVGAFVLIRDVTAESNLQDKYKKKATQSITDTLTGLYNRAYFQEYLPDLVKMLHGMPENSEQRGASTIMLDIDHFKKINDVHGHPAGDYVIKTVAELMLKCFRKTDVICRYGGEEFLAILPATPIVGAAAAAEKLRRTVAEHKFSFEGKTIPVSISSGIAQIDLGNEEAKDTIARADAALYFSKQSGRNRVSLHDGKDVTAAGPALVDGAA